jgi:SET domain-containing protein
MKIVVKKSKKYGRGLYAARDIAKGETVESSPAIILDKWESNRIASTILNCYAFSFGEEDSAIALGFGSLFNHSEKENITYKSNLKKKTIEFKAIRDIKKDEQLFIDYGYDPKWAREETSFSKKAIQTNESR